MTENLELEIVPVEPHLENHPQAFIDADGVVVNIAILELHDDKLMKQLVLLEPFAVSSVDCCEFGAARIGQIFDGAQFIDTVVEEPIVEEPIVEEAVVELPAEE